MYFVKVKMLWFLVRHFQLSYYNLLGMLNFRFWFSKLVLVFLNITLLTPKSKYSCDSYIHITEYMLLMK